MKTIEGLKTGNAAKRDTVDVEPFAATAENCGQVTITTRDNEYGDFAIGAFSPKQARKLAIALIEAAAEAEGRA